MSSVVFINPGHDTGGAGFAFKAAFDAVAPDWQARAICRNTTYLDYPTDLVWTPRDRSQRMTALLEAGDVVHAMNSPRPLGWFTSRPSQALVVHHLGTTFRRDPEAMSAICRGYGAIEVTDSIDLMLFPHISWLPIPADTDALAQLRREHFQPAKRMIRIAHAPTHRSVKNTEQIIAAVAELAKRHPIDFDLIEGVSNRACLVRKAQADIFVDQLMYGFGVNNIEAWAMGIPVVSGWADPTHRARCIELWGRLPWADATEATLEAVIEHLVTDAAWRAELGERGRAHAETYHSQESVVEQTLAVYQRAGLRSVA